MREKVITVTVRMKNQETEIENKIEELSDLVESSGGEVVATVEAVRDHIDPKTYIGSGKAQEIKDLMDKLEVQTICFNNELSGSQMRNLEMVLNGKIIDRTNLILDIFASRATSKEAVLQVELAQLQYRLPRLIGYRDYLSREGAGIGTRGPGEQKLELDRRVIQRQMTQIKNQLKQVKNMREVTRKKRVHHFIPQVSIIGYTNAGKSTIAKGLLNREGDEFQEKDQLFHTLDTTLRKVRLNPYREIILSDTVGFIEDLPTFLVESFKSTLEEVAYADLILEVVDSSSKNIEVHRKTTKDLLQQMKIDIPILTVFNKKDLLKEEDTLIYHGKDHIVVSAKSKEDLQSLKEKIEEMLSRGEAERFLLIPYEDQGIYYQLRKHFRIHETEYGEKGIYLKLSMNSSFYEKYKKYAWSGEEDV